MPRTACPAANLPVMSIIFGGTARMGCAYGSTEVAASLLKAFTRVPLHLILQDRSNILLSLISGYLRLDLLTACLASETKAAGKVAPSRGALLRRLVWGEAGCSHLLPIRPSPKKTAMCRFRSTIATFKTFPRSKHPPQTHLCLQTEKSAWKANTLSWLPLRINQSPEIQLIRLSKRTTKQQDTEMRARLLLSLLRGVAATAAAAVRLLPLFTTVHLSTLLPPRRLSILLLFRILHCGLHLFASKMMKARWSPNLKTAVGQNKKWTLKKMRKKQRQVSWWAETWRHMPFFYVCKNTEC
mmetsp:Transcript_8318/g.15852  ORF Transcript_8318/g.15852 Transcript_8318/m.15852 type:complete len:298 (+) Transcript_8318:747-1640(+)